MSGFYDSFSLPHTYTHDHRQDSETGSASKVADLLAELDEIREQSPRGKIQYQSAEKGKEKTVANISSYER